MRVRERGGEGEGREGESEREGWRGGGEGGGTEQTSLTSIYQQQH